MTAGRALATIVVTLSACARGATAPPATRPPVDAPYRIQRGDLVHVRVYRHPEFDASARPWTDGMISVPHLGQFSAAGLTPEGLADEIRKKLSAGFLQRPYVIVTVEEYQGMYYVMGEVQKPGAFRYADGLTVRKAIAQAGGLTERAAPDRTRIVRPQSAAGGAAEVTLEAQMDSPVKPNDTVLVPVSYL